MSWDAFIDPIASFLGQDAETQVGNLRKGLDDKYKPTFMDSFWGRANDGQAALDTAKDTSTRRAGERFLNESGYTGAELGLNPENTSVGAVASAIRRVEENKADGKSQTAFERSLVPLQMSQQQQTRTMQAQMAQSNAQFNATMQRQMANDAKSHQLQLMQFAEAKDQRANELEYQKMRDRKADMQYNERLEQLDRKDRRMAMSSIAAGLASLGAAFAM